MEVSLADTTSQLQQVQLGLAELERASTQAEAEEVHSRLKQALDTVCNGCDQLEQQASREPQHKRRNTKYRIDQLKYDHVHLVAALQAVRHKTQQRLNRASQRDELLQRKFATNDSTALQMAGGNDNEFEHGQRLSSAGRDLDDLLTHGQSVLSSLREQGFSLKGVRRRILDVGNQLGLSNTVMRMIEQRTAEDRVVLFTGMAVTSLIMLLIYWWLRW